MDQGTSSDTAFHVTFRGATAPKVNDRLESLLQRQSVEQVTDTNVTDLKVTYSQLTTESARNYVNCRDLKRFHRDERVPQGMMITVTNRFTGQYPELQAKWDRAQRLCSEELLSIMIETLSHRLKKQETSSSCKTTNVVYCITCTKCKMQYIGETKRRLMERLREDLRDITTKKDTPVASQLSSNHHNQGHVSIQILDIIHEDPTEDKTTVTRRQRERFWIYQLGTNKPTGDQC